MSKYLYGASIQGIQEFIFETNKLKEVIGASELVKKIKEEVKCDDGDVLLNAAGNIKILFNSKDEAKEFFKTLPKKVSQSAYGITVSQAVVEISGDYPDEAEFLELEKRLKAKRNRPNIPLDYKLSIIDKAPKTAKSAYKKDKEDEYIDVASKQKRDAATKSENDDFEKLANSKNKIAVIHADGNGLGVIVPVIAKAKLLKEFSEKLDKATEAAYEKASEGIEKIRKVILGGDDLSVVIDADYALKFTRDFLENFEKETEKFLSKGKFAKLGIKKLTACAGIAISNVKYPVYYSYALAEELTSYAKKISKSKDIKNPPSSLMFHNIQSGNFRDFDEIKQRELSVTDEEGREVNFCFAPYYLKETPKIDDFIEICKLFFEKESPSAKFREWLKSLAYSRNYSEITLSRINEISASKWKNYKTADEVLQKLGVSFEKPVNEEGNTPMYEIIEIVSNTKAVK